MTGIVVRDMVINLIYNICKGHIKDLGQVSEYLEYGATIEVTRERFCVLCRAEGRKPTDDVGKL